MEVSVGERLPDLKSALNNLLFLKPNLCYPNPSDSDLSLHSCAGMISCARAPGEGWSSLVTLITKALWKNPLAGTNSLWPSCITCSHIFLTHPVTTVLIQGPSQTLWVSLLLLGRGIAGRLRIVSGLQPTRTNNHEKTGRHSRLGPRIYLHPQHAQTRQDASRWTTLFSLCAEACYFLSS